jgi:endonuclease/exonuclease/phosphatase (EEP) superfamily protein YafD
MLLLALASGCGSIYRHADLSAPLPVLPAGDPAPALPGASLDVLVWNVKKAQRAAWRAEFDALVPGKELVLLQEAYLAPRMTEALAAAGELQWSMGPSFAFALRRGEPTTGVVVGSAARAVSQRGFVTDDTEPLAGTPKAAFAVTYAVEGSEEPLLVVCVHGINFRPARALETQLLVLEPVVSEHRGPVIFAGDLNTHHRPRMEVVEEFAARLGLRSAFDNQRRSGRARAGGDGRTRHRTWPLDHVFVRGLVVQDVRVVADARGSDHKPLILRVSVGAAADPVASLQR